MTFTTPLSGGERVLIRYGTALPAGVGAVKKGEVMHGHVDGVGDIKVPVG